MSRFLVLLMSGLCGLLNPHYSEEFLRRFSDSSIMVGYLAVPVSANSFILIENETLRSRVYYDHYSQDYLSYEQFLNSMMNSPGSIDLCRALRIYKTEKSSTRMAKEAHSNFDRFKAKYLQQRESDPSTFKIRNKYKRQVKQILKICFDEGLYLYWNDYAADWTILYHPQPSPPSL